MVPLDVKIFLFCVSLNMCHFAVCQTKQLGLFVLLIVQVSGCMYALELSYEQFDRKFIRGDQI